MTKNLIQISDSNTKCRVKVLQTSSSHLGWKSDVWIPLKASEDQDQVATNKKLKKTKMFKSTLYTVHTVQTCLFFTSTENADEVVD